MSMISKQQFDELVKSCEAVLTEHQQRIEALEELLLVQSKPRPKKNNGRKAASRKEPEQQVMIDG